MRSRKIRIMRAAAARGLCSFGLSMARVTEIPAADVPRHPCLQCGACCAHFRVSFYWAEADDASQAGVPSALTRPVSRHLRAMLGTDQAQPRCIALKGEVGVSTQCDIYPLRSSTCRDFEASYEYGRPNPHCDSARTRWGLAPLAPQDWENPDCEPPQPIAA